MYVFVLPASGGGFVSQLAILQHLCESEIIPSVTLGSSGGNVAAYIASAAQWKWAGIERIARELSQGMFITPWSNISSIASIIGYFKANIYDKGNGVGDFLSRYFTSTTITKNEIWTGTYNKDRQQARLFCNRSRESSILDISYINYNLNQSMEPMFTNGNLELISQGNIASASIPALVPPQKIMNEDYIDGCVSGASPLKIMQEPILQYVKDNNVPLHIIYINSINLSNPDIKPIYNVVDTLKQSTHDIVRSQTVIDRLAAYELLRRYPGTMNEEQFICNYRNIQYVKRIQSLIRYSLLEIYPEKQYDIDLVNFTGNDIVSSMKTIYKQCLCRLWWLSSEDDNINQKINDIIILCKKSSLF